MPDLLIPGATSAAFVPRPEDVGHDIYCRVRAENAFGFAFRNSLAVGPVASAVVNTPPVNIVAPSIADLDPEVDEVLHCDEGTWSGTPTPVYSFEWHRVSPEAPINLTPPVIADITPEVDEVLHTTDGTWSGVPDPTFDYEWHRVLPDPPTGGSPSITDITPEIDEVLHCDRGTWSGTAPITYVYEWHRIDPAATITSAASVSIAEGVPLAHELTANETVTWSLVGGSDLPNFDLVGSTLSWLAPKDFETPGDSDLNNVYVVIVRATDAASNTTDQTISVTVTNVAEAVIWDLATVANVTLSSGNLVVTNTGTTSQDQGAHVASISGKTSGKFYFEITLAPLGAGSNTGVGIGTAVSPYLQMGSSAAVGTMMFRSGSIWTNGGSSGFTLSARASGDVIGIAVNLDSRKAWFKKVSGTPSNWNGNVSHDPATGVGGVTVPAGTMVPFATFGGAGGTIGGISTANFGASSFVGAVPSGFTSGWTV